MSGLREQLLGGVEGIPPFRLALPHGWEAHPTTAEAEETLLDAAKKRLMQAHQPAAYTTLSAQVAESFKNARAQGAFLMILPGPDAPTALSAPVSILGSVLRQQQNASLDVQISRAIEEYGARPLGGSKHFLRWVNRRTVRLSGDAVGAETIVYVTPIPGTERRRALRLTATLAYPLDRDPDSDPDILGWAGLLDSHMATFAWEPLP